MKIRFILAIAALAAATLACCNLPATPTLPPVTMVPLAPTQTPPPPRTEAPTVPPTLATTELPTEIPTEPPTEAPTAAPTLPPPPTATEPPPPPGLAIVSFTVDAEDIPPTGKRLTFNWQTTGAVRAIIWSGTSQRFPQAWDVPSNGTRTEEVLHTNYRNPTMTLVAYDAADNQVSQSVTVEWPCQYDYFFTTDVARCPSYEASTTWAAEQPFEHGRMIWLEEINTGGGVIQKIIVVLYADGKFAWYDDTWIEGMPESDPALVPPPGLWQPIRGFGKLWRENASVRDGLGWATVPEQGFDTTWQPQIAESIGATAFVRIFNGKVIQINGWDVKTGTWQYLP